MIRLVPNPEIVAVSGLARSGSSMTMQMLAAGGMPCVGRYPDFEVDTSDTSGASRWRGTAIKLIEPQHFAPPAGEKFKVIWLDRDVRQQAKSTFKMMRALSGEGQRDAHKSHLRDMERIIREDRLKALRVWGGLNAKILRMRFEQIVRRPKDAAEDIARFIGDGLDVEAMAAAVVRRQPACLPYLLEVKQLEAR